MLAGNNVFQHAHVGEQADGLECATNSGLGDFMRRQPGDVLAVPTDVPVGWLIDARNHVEYGRLAGAIGADEPDNLAGTHLEAKIVNRAQAAKGRKSTRLKSSH